VLTRRSNLLTKTDIRRILASGGRDRRESSAVSAPSTLWPILNDNYDVRRGIYLYIAILGLTRCSLDRDIINGPAAGAGIGAGGKRRLWSYWRNREL